MPGLAQVVLMKHGRHGQAQLYREVPEMKPTILLAVALFLISAPEPDASDIAEMTSNFIVPRESSSLMAFGYVDARNPVAETRPAIEETAEANQPQDPATGDSESNSSTREVNSFLNSR